MNNIPDYVLFHNPLSVWATALLTTLVFAVGMTALKSIIVRRLTSLVLPNTVFWRDVVVEVLSRTRKFTIFALSAFLGSQLLTLPTKLDFIDSRIAFLVLLYQVSRWGTSLITITTNHYLNGPGTDGARATSVRAISFLARLLFFGLILLWALDNLGVNITTLVAGLGVGGVAIALAVQNILGDLFASLTIVLDKPFVLGDTIAVDQFEGTIESIGLKTTRLRSTTGEQLVFPNGGLLQSRIRNLKRMQERRGLFVIGVTYETSAEKLRRIPEWVKGIIEAQPCTRFGRAHFKTFGPSSLDFEILYWVTDTDYLKFMNTQQAINLALVEKFQAEAVSFAYPTQTLFVQKLTDKSDTV